MIRYESCETTLVTLQSASDIRKALATSDVMTGSRHWLGILVNTWMAEAPIAAPRAGAL